MTILRFRDLDKGGDGDGEKNKAQPTGQTVLSDDQFSQLISALGSTTQQQGTQQSPQAQPKSAHQLLGLSDEDVKAVTESLGGEKAAGVILSLLAKVKRGADDTDAILLNEFKKQNELLAGKLDEQSENFKKFGAQQQSDVFTSLGLTQVFTEENAEDLSEMMDAITERSGGFVDAKKKFDEAVDAGDIPTLLNFKEKFEGFVKHKYKNHQSVSGGDTANNRTALEKRETAESDIDKLQKERDSYLSGPNKDFAKANEVQDKIDELAESLKT